LTDPESCDATQTTLQMAINSPADATVITLDLPEGASAVAPLDANDRAYTIAPPRRYTGRPHAHKIVQHLGDSATFDFAAVAAKHGPIDLAFIDGSHSYEYVENDTQKVLACLAPRGMVLWHDFTPGWPGVVRYLSELHRRLPLVRIAGTSLVVLDRSRVA
jgi:predicted O-methyltransferase YrrM